MRKPKERKKKRQKTEMKNEKEEGDKKVVRNEAHLKRIQCITIERKRNMRLCPK